MHGEGPQDADPGYEPVRQDELQQQGHKSTCMALSGKAVFF